MASSMNRIREIREAAKLTSDELAALCVPPTSGAQIRRLETVERNLTHEWMCRIAMALGCNVAALIANVDVADDPDVQRVRVEPEAAERAMASRGLHVYRVLGTSVCEGRH
jgi:transcriptional regulator with XRE-family HTH domain